MKTRRGKGDWGLSRRSRTRLLAHFDRFEDRVLMATFTVTSTGDNPTTGVAGDGTLRGEILASNAAPAQTGINVINFNLPTGLQTITLAGSLPAITAGVNIDGTTQAGFTGTPLIEINGNATPGPGLLVQAAGVQIQALIINHVAGDGIDLDGTNGLVDGSWIGINNAGSGVAANLGNGIQVASSGNTIGGTTSGGGTPVGPNVISGNGTKVGSGDGILVSGGVASNTLITHNFIGTDSTGKKAIGNEEFGIDLEGATNTVGGVDTAGPNGAGNLISGNLTGGIAVGGGGTTTNIEGNFIGTDISGLAPIPNLGFGVELANVTKVTIGGTVTGAGDVISGNSGYGIEVTEAATNTADLNDQIQGNDIGVGVNKVAALGNGETGVFVLAANGVTVGGTTFGGNPEGLPSPFGNIIANNGASGGTVDDFGVEIRNGQGDGILSNSIYNNTGLGIKLTSGNAGVAAPVITQAESGAGETRISGSYFGTPNTPYRLQFFYTAPQTPLKPGQGQNYIADLDVVTNNVGVATFTTTLNSAVPVGDSFTATATQEPLVTNDTSQFSTSFTVTKAALTDLAVSTSVPATGPLLDQPYAYTITVTNNGPDPATGVVFTDTLPADSQFISATASPSSTTQPVFANGTVVDDIGDLGDMPPDSSVVITIDVKPILITSNFTNTATVIGNELDTNQTNNTSTTTGAVAPDSDLTVQLTASQSPTPVGSPVTYTLLVGNNGPSTANNTVVTVTLPADFTSIQVVPDKGTFTIGTDNTITIDTGTLPSSSSSTIIITATPTQTTAPMMPAVVTASAMSAQIDPNQSNNTASASVDVVNAADLALAMTASPSPVLAGQELLYTIEVTNNGPSSASAPTVVDELPANVTFDPTNSTAGPNGTISFAGSTVVASFSALIPGGTYPLTIAVIPQVSGLLSNTATVGDPNETSPDELDPDLSNNTATAVVAVSPADLQVDVNNPADPLFIGQDAVYTIDVTNNGPATATNVTLTDSFNPGGTIVGVSRGTVTNGVLTADVGTLAGGQSVAVTVTVDPTQAGYTGHLINSAGVVSDEYDPDTNNNTSSSSNLVSPVDLGVLVAGSPTTSLTGHPVTYVVAVTNNGPAVATNVLLSDTLPANSTFDSAASTGGSVALAADGTLAGNLGTIAVGQTVLVTIVVTPTAIETATNTATVTADNVVSNGTTNGSIANSVSSGASVAVTNVPGSFQFDSPVTFVPEDAGAVTLTIDRVGGNLGAVTIDYATSDSTAVSGTNYVGTSGTVAFADGQTSATITIQVLDDAKVDGSHGFFVTLGNPTGGSSVGAPDVAAVVVTNTDRDTVPPYVTGLIAVQNGSAIDGFKVTFDKPMDINRIAILSNYHIFITDAGSAQAPVAIAGVSYNLTDNSVTIIPTAPLPANRFYRVVVNGSSGPALTDVAGNVLFGSSGPGTNYDAFYGQGTSLSYDDSRGNLVSINISGGGTLSIFRAANGDAESINLNGIVPHKTKLTGSVKKLSKKGSGFTIIGEINGFGQFGFVNSKLTTPSFYVGSAPVSAASVPAESVTTAKVKAKAATAHASVKAVVSKATPKGPKQSTKN